MDHVAIMSGDWELTEKILSGEKTIESRWYKNKYAPWDRIKSGDAVYFKEGKYVSVKASVERVLQFSDLNKDKVRGLLEKYHKEDGIDKSKIESYYQLFKDKKYCILVFLQNVEKMGSFEIDKKGFGSMAAWVCIEDVNKIKI